MMGYSTYEQAAKFAEADGNYDVAAQLRSLAGMQGLGKKEARGSHARILADAPKARYGSHLGSLGYSAVLSDDGTYYNVVLDDGSETSMTVDDFQAWRADQDANSSGSWFTAENLALAAKFGVSILQIIQNSGAYGAKPGLVYRPPAQSSMPSWAWAAIAAAGVLGVGYALSR